MLARQLFSFSKILAAAFLLSACAGGGNGPTSAQNGTSLQGGEFVPQSGEATAQEKEHGVTLADLRGPWAMSLIGQTGCGNSALYVTFTLNAAGQGSASIRSHTSGCPDGVTSALPFVIQSLNSDGSGTANLSCGTACGWNLTIQVGAERQIFSAIDVSPVNPGNFLEGTAIRQVQSSRGRR